MKKRDRQFKDDEEKIKCAQKLGLGVGWKLDFYDCGKRFWVTPQDKKITDWKEVAKWHEERNLPVPPFFRKEVGAQNMDRFLKRDENQPIQRQMGLHEFFNKKKAAPAANENRQDNSAQNAQEKVVAEEKVKTAADSPESAAKTKIVQREFVAEEKMEIASVARKKNVRKSVTSPDKVKTANVARTKNVRKSGVLEKKGKTTSLPEGTAKVKTASSLEGVAQTKDIQESVMAAEKVETVTMSDGIAKIKDVLDSVMAAQKVGAASSSDTVARAKGMQESVMGAQKVETASLSEGVAKVKGVQAVIGGKNVEAAGSLKGAEEDESLSEEEFDIDDEMTAHVADQEMEPRHQLSGETAELLRRPDSEFLIDKEPIKMKKLKLSLKHFLEAAQAGLPEHECYKRICVPIQEFDEFIFTPTENKSRWELTPQM